MNYSHRQNRFRIENDFYPTPPEAVRALLSVEDFDGDIWEPACGDGAIAKELQSNGYNVTSTDLIDRGYGEGNLNFLNEQEPRAKHIITNPPYGSGLADQFIRHAIILTRKTGGSVAMLLNLTSLCHRTRTCRFRKTPPAALYAVDDIVCWPKTGYGDPPSYFKKHRYVWAVWKPEHRGPSKFWWLSGNDFR